MKNLMLYIALFSLGMGTVRAQTSGNALTVKGEIKTITKPVKMVMFSIDQSVLKVDSCMSDALGKFEFKGTVNIPVKATVTYVESGINAIEVVGQDLSDKAVLFLEPGVIEIRGNRLDDAKIQGNIGQSDFEELLKLQSTSANDSINFNFIKSHPASYVSLWLLKSYTRRAEPKLLNELFNGLSGPVRTSEAGLMVDGFVKTAVATAIGKPAIELNAQDINGKPISLAEFRGKLVLIDFWASWCGPCRLENKDVLKVYKNYATKGFEIVGISLDTQKDKWVKAVQEDELTWRQLCDVNQELAKVYGIRSLPQNVLIDGSGIIIAKNLRSAQLESKLRELLGTGRL